MSFFESQIDPTEFGLIAGYLKSPQSPIRTLLHVRNQSDLAKLADTLWLKGSLIPADGRIPEFLKPMLRSGDLKVSFRDGMSEKLKGATVDADKFPSTTTCRVIYAPPYYLVHTPGLFEWHNQQQGPNKSEGRQRTEPGKQTKDQQERSQQRTRENSR